MKINWRQIIFLGLGVMMSFFDRQHWDRLSMSLAVVILDYSVVEVGWRIGEGYGWGSGGRYEAPKDSNLVSRFNLKLGWFGLLLIAILTTIFWMKGRLV